jgi:hypothetical protein
MAGDAGVAAVPGHAELELADDAGGHPEHEVDQEEAAPELRRPQVALLARAHPHRLQDRGEQCEADGERHEEEVVDGGGEAELPAGEQQRVQAVDPFASVAGVTPGRITRLISGPARRDERAAARRPAV